MLVGLPKSLVLRSFPNALRTTQNIQLRDRKASNRRIFVSRIFTLRSPWVSVLNWVSPKISIVGSDPQVHDTNKKNVSENTRKRMNANRIPSFLEENSSWGGAMDGIRIFSLNVVQPSVGRRKKPEHVTFPVSLWRDYEASTCSKYPIRCPHACLIHPCTRKIVIGTVALKLSRIPTPFGGRSWGRKTNTA